MFQPWRIQLRQAEEALAAARLDEARAFVRQGDLPEYLPAKKLMARLATQFVQRGQKHAELGQSLAGWRDLEAAAELGAATDTLGPLREQLVAQALNEAERYLSADEPAAAIARLQALQARGQAGAEVRELLRLADKLQAAGRFARQANFAAADAELAGAVQLRPRLPLLQQRRDELRRKEIAFRALRADLHDALAAERWSEVVNLAERVLELVPGDEVAKEARAKAWSVAGVKSLGEGLSAASLAETQTAILPYSLKSEARSPEPEVSCPMNSASSLPAARFLMWIDGVGGYLVCEGDEVVLGQPVAGGRVDVPILGDVSRDHAAIRRSGEGYLLVPRRATRLNGREIHDPAPLADGAIIELGTGVRLRFRQPHPLSRTARLDFVSRHRTQPPTDGVLLMAELCILGPAASNHVVCDSWSQDLVLFREESGLHCRSAGDFQIDGAPCHGQAAIQRSSHIISEEFSVTLEEV